MHDRHDFDAEHYPDNPQKAAEVIISLLRSIRGILITGIVWITVLAVLHACTT